MRTVLAKELQVPVSSLGPLDERPEPDGVRLRGSAVRTVCNRKVLRRFGVPFTYYDELPAE